MTIFSNFWGTPGGHVRGPAIAVIIATRHRPISCSSCSAPTPARNYQAFGAALVRDPASPRLASGQWPAVVVSPPPSTPAIPDTSTSETRLFSRVAKDGSTAVVRVQIATISTYASIELGRYSTVINAEKSSPIAEPTPQREWTVSPLSHRMRRTWQPHTKSGFKTPHFKKRRGKTHSYEASGSSLEEPFCRREILGRRG